MTSECHIQLDMFDFKKDTEPLEKTIDGLRSRFGQSSIQRCAMLLDRQLTGFFVLDAKNFTPQDLPTTRRPCRDVGNARRVRWSSYLNFFTKYCYPSFQKP